MEAMDVGREEGSACKVHYTGTGESWEAFHNRSAPSRIRRIRSRYFPAHPSQITSTSPRRWAPSHLLRIDEVTPAVCTLLRTNRVVASVLRCERYALADAYDYVYLLPHEDARITGISSPPNISDRFNLAFQPPYSHNIRLEREKAHDLYNELQARI